jgi:hypothetical protein
MYNTCAAGLRGKNGTIRPKSYFVQIFAKGIGKVFTINSKTVNNTLTDGKAGTVVGKVRKGNIIRTKKATD